MLRDNAIEISCNHLQTFNKKSERRGTKAVTNTPLNQKLTGKLSKPIIRKFQKRKLYSLSMDNI